MRELYRYKHHFQVLMGDSVSDLSVWLIFCMSGGVLLWTLTL